MSYHQILSTFIVFCTLFAMTSCTESTVTKNITPPTPVTPHVGSLDTAVTETIRLGKVELNVENISLMKHFYHEIIGLDIIASSSGSIDLGDGGVPLIRLIETPGYTHPRLTEAGLYHTAIVHGTRKDLSIRIARVLDLAPDQYSGSADHIATEAFYFTDPEGNGLELYYDKPRKDWQYNTDGKPVMGTLGLDVLGYIGRYSTLPISGGIARMGHVHLKVGDIETARHFYVDLLGFDQISMRDGALFVSRDNYHHHLGLNTWESLGAGIRDPKSFGLRSIEIHILNPSILEEIQKHLEQAKYPYTLSGTGLIVQDPWGNSLSLRSGK